MGSLIRDKITAENKQVLLLWSEIYGGEEKKKTNQKKAVLFSAKINFITFGNKFLQRTTKCHILED